MKVVSFIGEMNASKFLSLPLDISLEIKKHNSDTRNNSKFHSNNSIMDQLEETVECDIRHATRKRLVFVWMF